jgi:hypothetical protein
MKSFTLTVGAVAFLLLASGCMTTATLTKLPTIAEFNKDLPTLQKEYPDLTKYASKSRECAPICTMPDAEPLIEAWCNPHHKRFSAIMWFDPARWIFEPTTCWYWEFEDKVVVARISHPMGFNYTPHVWKLKVKQK